jgi:hypothetical protein
MKAPYLYGASGLMVLTLVAAARGLIWYAGAAAISAAALLFMHLWQRRDIAAQRRRIAAREADPGTQEPWTRG